MARALALAAATTLAACTTSGATPPTPEPPPTLPPTAAPPATEPQAAPPPPPAVTAPPVTAGGAGVTSPPAPDQALPGDESVGADALEAQGQAESDVVAAICAAWGDECGHAVAVARCESSLRPDARNGAHYGLFQVATDVHAARIARMGFTRAQMLEVGPNIAVAHALWAEQEWRPWTCAA